VTTNNSSAVADPGDAFRRWLSGAHAPAHSRRTAAVNAAFFLPYLRPGMDLLDAGCGPGSITIGLAEAVAPGKVVGIDTNPAAIGAARQLAAEHRVANVSFEVVDLHESPFPPANFDAIFAHAVFQHVPDAKRAAQSLRKMLRPGGVIGVADADYEGSIIAPQSPALRRAMKLMVDVRRLSGGDLRVGSKLRAILAAAGVSDTVGSAMAMVQGTPESARATGESNAAYYASPELVRHVIAMGWATQEQLVEISQAWQKWGSHPGAFWARFWCQAVGRAP
jgi:ubiquinone/menaquinone biosynthesis C-methylase UbiE